MDPSRNVTRAIAVALCGSLLMATSGCAASGQQRAQEQRELIRVGMVKEQVKQQIGEPTSRKVEGGSLVYETWEYNYKAPENSTLQVVAGILVMALVVAAVAAAAKGGGGSGSLNLGGGGGGGGSKIYQFRVYFDASGRVSDISLVKPAGQ